MKKSFVTIEAKDGRSTYNLLALPGSKKFKINIVFDYGADLERLYHAKYAKEVYGVSHLTEHLCFKSPLGHDSAKLLAEFKKEVLVMPVLVLRTLIIILIQ